VTAQLMCLQTGELREVHPTLCAYELHLCL
jgi:hypothetical protein